MQYLMQTVDGSQTIFIEKRITASSCNLFCLYFTLVNCYLKEAGS